jgi:hypothetical protein
MRFAALVLSAAAALLALEGQTPGHSGSPPAHPAAGVSPIKLNSCVFAVGAGGSLGQAAQIQVDYTVVGTVPAKDVLFVVHWNDGSTATAHDSGTFTPGHAINHKLPIALQRHLTTEMIITVGVSAVGARLADGTTWTIPRGSAPVKRCQVYPTGR